MLFNSYQFGIFFFLVVFLYFTLPHRFRWCLLLAASYYFYMAWRKPYVLLIIASTGVDYFAALGMSYTRRQAIRRLLLLFSLISNLGLLFTFKYFNFFADAANTLSTMWGSTVTLPYLQVLLPVGISFYTFQTLSYTLEVYQGRQQPERHLGHFALYVAFFPQLVAGPIERAHRLLPQLRRKVDFDYDRIRSGLILMGWGLFKKVVIADRLARVVDIIFAQPDRFPGLFLATGAVFFAFQIYCDFAGYTDIARGAARILGIDLMENFRRPYNAQSIADFWRRWHISLSTWFRDYLYLPLGGNRVSPWRWVFNILIVFLLSGLWHGANWTFLVWGGLHGTYYLIGRFSQSTRSHLAQKYELNRFLQLLSPLKMLSTFILVTLAWIFFRANTVQEGWYVVSHLPIGIYDLSDYGGADRLLGALDISLRALLMDGGLILFLLLVEAFLAEQDISTVLTQHPWWIRWSVYVSMLIAVMNLGVLTETPFVYFQF